MTLDERLTNAIEDEEMERAERLAWVDDQDIEDIRSGERAAIEAEAHADAIEAKQNDDEKWTTRDGTFDTATYVFDETGATVAVIPKRGTDAEHAARVAMIVNTPETARQRDELLAACKAVLRFIDGSEPCIKRSAIFDEVNIGDVVRAAIDTVTGENE